jgi:hypothetical protein
LGCLRLDLEDRNNRANAFKDSFPVKIDLSVARDQKNPASPQLTAYQEASLSGDFAVTSFQGMFFRMI